MPYTDSHIHFQNYKSEEVKNVVNNALKKGVCRFVNVSAHPSDWPEVEKLAALYPQIIPAFGVHPWYINAASSEWRKNLEKLLNANSTAWIGESGIDRLREPDVVKQQEFFRFHAELAKQYNRPLVIHAVKADKLLREMFDILPSRCIFHSFTGSKEWGSEIQKHGFYVGLNFSILRKTTGDDIIRSLDMEHVLLETDGPYQAMEKGKKSFPEELPLLVAKIASVQQTSPEVMEQRLYQNWLNFIGD